MQAGLLHCEQAISFPCPHACILEFGFEQCYVHTCRGGKAKLQSFFQGQVMRETGGRVNPALLAELLPAMLSGGA